MLGYSVAEAMVYSPNSVEVINDGSRMFEALFDDLRRARKYINLQFYIIANDPLGRQLGDILIERAKAGVKIRSYMTTWVRLARTARYYSTVCAPTA